MLAGMLLILSVWVGYLTAKYFFPKISSIELVALAWILSILVLSWLSIIFISLTGYTVGLIGTVLTLIIVGGLLFRNTRHIKINTQRTSLSLILFLVLWGSLFLWLFKHAVLRPEFDGWHTAPYTYGDLALHSSFIHYFAEQNNFSIQHPLITQKMSTYPFLINFHTALLVRLGWSIQSALIVTGVFSMLAILILLYQWCHQINKHIFVPWIASGLFFFNGGAGWWWFFAHLPHLSQLGSFLSNVPVDYTNWESENLLWTNVITTHILPQRGFMIGLAIVILIIRLLQIAWQSKKIGTSQLLFLGMVIGLTPLFHSHSFLFLAPLFIWLLVWAKVYQKIETRQLIIAVIPIVIVGGNQLWFMTSNSDQSLLQLQLGWITNGQFIFFWIKNMGLNVAVLLIGTVAFYHTYKNSFESLLILPCLAVYVLCNIFIFQPNAWDNMKFMLLVFLIPSILTSVVIADVTKTTFQKITVTILLCMTMLSGVLSVIYFMQKDWLLISQAEIDMAVEIKNSIPKDSLLLTSDHHNHLIPMLTGRPIVLGYKGWLWSHGIDYSVTEQKIAHIYAGEPIAEQLIGELNIDYIFISNKERAVFTVNEKFFADRYEEIYQRKDVIIYQVQ